MLYYIILYCTILLHYTTSPHTLHHTTRYTRLHHTTPHHKHTHHRHANTLHTHTHTTPHYNILHHTILHYIHIHTTPHTQHVRTSNKSLACTSYSATFLSHIIVKCWNSIMCASSTPSRSEICLDLIDS